MFSHGEDTGRIQTDKTPKINTFQTMRKEVSGMAVFRIEKTRDYTVMSNHHLRNTDLSLKAKGLLSLMLSLPEDWDYTMKGLARICKDGIDSISGGIRELEAHGYLIRERIRNENGQLGSIEYTILEQPKPPAPTMRPLDERGAWAAKSKKEYDLDENGERIRLPSGRYKTHKVDLTGWNDKGNALLWRKAWADISNAYLERAGHPERIDYRSNAERGIDELPTVHMGVAACQMEKKGIATEKGELNRNIRKANRLIREIRAQIGKLKEWIGELFKARETAPEQPPQSPGLANLLMKYLSVQREKSRKYSQSWQRQHAADELKTVAKAVNYLSEHGISTLAELDAALSSVSDQADAIREGMKTAEKRMKELQKLIEYGKNYTEYKPIHDELKKLKNGWTSKRDKYEEAHRAELTLWNAASRYLHANLPKGTKTLPISEWEKEYATLSGQRTAEYTKLKETRAEVAELHNIRKCVDIALKADQPEQTRAKRHDLER